MAEVLEVQTEEFIVTVEDCGDIILREAGPSEVVLEEQQVIEVVEVQTETTVVEQATDIQVVEKCEAGPQGPPGTSLHTFTTLPIAPTLTGIIRSTPLTTAVNFTWHTAVEDQVTGDVQSFTVKATHNGVSVGATAGSFAGTPLLFEPFVVVVGSNIEFSLQNNSSNDLVVSILEITVG